MRAKLGDAEIGPQKQDLFAKSDMFIGRHAGKLGQVFGDPTPPEPTPLLHSLQIDEPHVASAWRDFLDEEMAAVEVAMIEAGRVEAPRDVGGLDDETTQQFDPGGVAASRGCDPFGVSEFIAILSPGSYGDRGYGFNILRDGGRPFWRIVAAIKSCTAPRSSPASSSLKRNDSKRPSACSFSP